MIKRNWRLISNFVYSIIIKNKNMSCSGGSKTKKGRYNKANNLKQPTGYTVDAKGNVKPIYSK
jgi:hypothetical protein